MERTLLYYPTIDIPNMKWLYSSILYADKVSSIVPFNDINDNRFPDLLKYLVDQEQYKPIFIERLLSSYNTEFNEFEEFFISTTSSDEFQVKLKNGKGLSYQHYDKLYSGKMTYRINQYMREAGLIKSTVGDVFVTDEIVSLFYMSLLAQYVTKIIKDDFIIPSTDDKRYQDISFNSSKQKEPAMNFILENCLPTPVENTPIEKIIDFKKARRDELLEFRKYLSKVQEKIRKATEEQEIKEIQIDTKENIEKAINDLSKLCKENSIKTFFTSFESLLKLDSPKLFQTLSVTGAVTTAINPLFGVVAGLIGISGGIASSYFSNRREIDKSELAYLFKARQEGVI